MHKHKGITLVGLIVVTLVIIFFVIAMLPLFMRTGCRGCRVVCGTNLKGLGNAIIVYASEHKDKYPQLPGSGPWSKELGFAYDLPKPNFSLDGEQGNVGRTISASWYLLVREADVSPKSFTCPESKQKEFDGKNPQNRDITDLWDFGNNPYPHVSYAMHNPYGKFPANGSRAATFAVAADMSPWFENGDILPPGNKGKHPRIITANDPNSWRLGLGRFHEQQKQYTPGQFLLYADGHNSYETKPNVGVNNDNIYTYWSTDKDPNQQDIEGGTAPTNREPSNDAKSLLDSFLAI